MIALAPADWLRHPWPLAVSVGVTAALGLGVWVGRRHTLVNEVARGLVIALMATSAAVTAHRALAWRFDTPIAETLTVDTLLVGMLTVAASLLDRRFWPAVAPVALALALQAAVPGRAAPLFGFACAAPLLVVALRLRR